jgi:hypothetical protein
MRNSTIPVLNQVVPISGSYAFSEEDSIASIQASWGGGTVTLPGPGSGHNTPNNGDTYTLFDGQNALLKSGNPVTVNGGGYRFLSGGGLVTQTTLTIIVATTTGSIQQSCLQFVFDAAASIWLVC